MSKRREAIDGILYDDPNWLEFWKDFCKECWLCINSEHIPGHCVDNVETPGKRTRFRVRPVGRGRGSRLDECYLTGPKTCPDCHQLGMVSMGNWFHSPCRNRRGRDKWGRSRGGPAHSPVCPRKTLTTENSHSALGYISHPRPTWPLAEPQTGKIEIDGYWWMWRIDGVAAAGRTKPLPGWVGRRKLCWQG